MACAESDQPAPGDGITGEDVEVAVKFTVEEMAEEAALEASGSGAGEPVPFEIVSIKEPWI